MTSKLHEQRVATRWHLLMVSRRLSKGQVPMIADLGIFISKSGSLLLAYAYSLLCDT